MLTYSHIKGSAVIEYILPLALVGIVVGLGLFYLFNNGHLDKFISNSAGQKTSSSGSIIIGESKQDSNSLIVSKPQTGSEGTPDNPNRECKNGLCTIDYGTFVLEGIPENFNEFVQTQGSSGGTDKLTGILEQIAIQLNNEGYDEQTINNIMNLANNGHEMANTENLFESMLNQCGTDQQCIHNIVHDDSKPLQENGRPGKTEYYDLLYDSLTIGRSMNALKNDPEKFQEELNQGKNNYKFVNNLNSIINDPNLPDEIKGVIQELSWEIGIIGEEFQNNVLIAGGYNGNDLLDPLTGESTPYKAPENSDFIDFFHNYNASTISNVDSALICAAGYNSDTGSNCH